MEDLLVAALAVLRWRVILVVIAGIGAAVVCVRSIPWLSGVQGIALVLASLVVGLAWESHARGVSLTTPDQERKTAVPVAALAFAVGGAFWGLLSSTGAGPTALGAILLIVGLAGWGWIAVQRRRTLHTSTAVLYSGAALAGYAAPVAYTMLNG